MKKFVFEKLENWKKVAHFLKNSSTNIHLLEGDLGAGKTTLVKFYMQLFDLDNEVSSPTFGIINQYALESNPVFHIDLYRLDNNKDLEEIGIFEILHSGYTIFIEWPELIKPFIPLPYNLVSIDHQNKKRVVHVEMVNT